ncbi:hypothetical protein MK805_15390 [Shimazuella sp. AN120528]|uniref:hypothetical protein n=1 Tax=Shimazuella soli TaxID=1892854 RepID=UPI001F10D652|nr:hypothetical protein [Shimazuella soli]MCH5586326.1 hypothetical protein [Shimazuella soli]
MFIKELKVEKYCHEDDTYTLVATLSENVDLTDLKDHSIALGYRIMMLPSCLILRNERQLTHIYEDGFCILHHFSSIKKAEEFLLNLLILKQERKLG